MLHFATVGEPANTTTDWIIAVGTVIAALGTVAAVTYALLQGRRQSRADLHVEAKQIIERVGSTRRGRNLLRLVGINHGPQSIKVSEARLQFESGTGAMIGQMTAGGDALPKVLSPGDAVTAEWDFNAVEYARGESNGEPYAYLAFIDAFGNEHAAPYPGMRRKRRLPGLQPKYVPAAKRKPNG